MQPNFTSPLNAEAKLLLIRALSDGISRITETVSKLKEGRKRERERERE
jgi:hypothetical protein